MRILKKKVKTIKKIYNQILLYEQNPSSEGLKKLEILRGDLEKIKNQSSITIIEDQTNLEVLKIQYEQKKKGQADIIKEVRPSAFKAGELKKRKTYRI